MKPTRFSIVIATHNRRVELLNTLDRLTELPPTDGPFEVIVVDNASTDGTACAVRSAHPQVTVIESPLNLGSCAKNLALDRASGEIIVFLDDDSFPQPGSLRRLWSHLRADPHLAAASFTVTRPDGSRECSAYPDVFIGCGVGLRRSALEQVGGLPDDFFMQGEEYDLSLRLISAGWRVRTFDDLHVTHLKTSNARQSDRTVRLDVANNIVLAMRHLPAGWRWRFAIDWTLRYRWIARRGGLTHAWSQGVWAGIRRAVLDRRRRSISPAAFERFAKIDLLTRRMIDLGARGVSRVLLLQAGKNLPAFVIAARRARMTIVAIADDRLAAPGRRYRGIRILPESVARSLDFQTAVVSDLSPVHRAQALDRWQEMGRTIADVRPVIDLLETPEPVSSEPAPAPVSHRIAAHIA